MTGQEKMESTNWTPYADVNEIVAVLVTAVPPILGDNFVGLYLDGSLASGDFEYETSDIDFVVATAVPISPSQFDALVELHGRIGQLDTKWAIELEGAYIPVDALRRYDPANAIHPYIDRGASNLRWEHLAVDWVIHRYVLHNCGITLAGPPIQTLVDPVSSEELRQAVRELFDVWWADDPIQLQHDGYRVYAILTMCRMLVTWQTGKVVSKPAAAQWALATLAERWTKLIEQALAWRSGSSVINLDETRNFIQFTQAQLAVTPQGGRQLQEGMR